MANTSAAKKYLLRSEKNRMVNKSRKTSVRTVMKNVESEIKLGNKENAMKALKLFEKKGMMAVSKGVFHINTIARKISRLYARIKSIGVTKA